MQASHRHFCSAKLRRPLSGVVLALGLGGLASLPGHAAELDYTLTFNDPSGLGASYYGAIDSHIGAALDAWSVYLKGAAQLEIKVDITSAIPRATGRSASSGFVRHTGQFDIYEQGMAYELRTGVDNNGVQPDIELAINPDYLSNELWFDPSPAARTAPVGTNRTDAMSVIMHEVGHALAFNGWGGAYDGDLPAAYASTWDELIEFDTGVIYFTGANAQTVYGGRVPVTVGNNFHLGNANGPGQDLVADLMNGVVYYREQRYGISALDVAMLRDMGVPMAAQVPEPAALALMLAGLAVVVVRRQR
jgi:hypothetical protein